MEEVNLTLRNFRIPQRGNWEPAKLLKKKSSKYTRKSSKNSLSEQMVEASQIQWHMPVIVALAFRRLRRQQLNLKTFSAP